MLHHGKGVLHCHQATLTLTCSPTILGRPIPSPPILVLPIYLYLSLRGKAGKEAKGGACPFPAASKQSLGCNEETWPPATLVMVGLFQAG